MGCGRVGSTLARSLEDRNHTVSVIDSEPDAFRRLGPGFNGDKVTGYGFDQAVLEKAGIRRADAFAAVSSGDNSNIIAARVARETFGIQQVVARIYDPGRAEVYQRLGITTVATVKWTADQVLRRLLPAGAEADFRDPSGTIRVDQVPIPEQWVGQRTIHFQEPLLNLFVTGDNRRGIVVGQIFTENVKNDGRNLFCADLVRERADARRDRHPRAGCSLWPLARCDGWHVCRRRPS